MKKAELKAEIQHIYDITLIYKNVDGRLTISEKKRLFEARLFAISKELKGLLEIL